MKKIMSLFSLVLISSICISQTVIEVPANSADSLSKIYTSVDQEASFPGGSEAWRKYLLKNLKINIPVKNGVPDGTYHVVAKFIVSKDGTISDVYTTTKFGYGMEEEVIRFIKKSPNWEPAIINGRKVNSRKTQPITFLYATQ